MLLVVYFISFSLFCHQTAATTQFILPTPLDPSYVEELQEIMLVWNYTLDGTVGTAIFARDTGGGDEEIARTQSGSTNLRPGFQSGRFSADASDTQAWLKITRVQKSDQGKYGINLVVTPTGFLQNKVDVFVRYEPNVTIEHCSTNVTKGDNVTVSCNATGSPTPETAWIRERTGEVLSYSKIHQITGINRNETGAYVCLAWNGIGRNNSKSCLVVVQFPPKVAEFVQEYKVGVQQSVTLQCQAEGHPEPTFSWSPCKDSCNTATLTIPEVLNDTVYTCTATNSVGNDSADASVGKLPLNL